MNNNLELALKIKVLIDGIKGVETLVGQLRTLTQASNAGTNDATAQLRDGLDQTTVAIKGVAAELGKLLNAKKQPTPSAQASYCPPRPCARSATNKKHTTKKTNKSKIPLLPRAQASNR